ncbi:MAG: protein-glutamate O-methyltransferase CheR [Firmicutes bacterium]|nr:protein-glutamate O-methyltransferase CheR [Bacillota bacterium]
MLNITSEEFAKLAAYIQANYGIHLKKEKKTLLTARLQGILASKNFKNFTEYYEYLLQDRTGQAAAELVNKITTNHTYFMREPEHFYFFRDQVLPEIKAQCRQKDLRIWCAACSTGEEAYTLAMIIDEFFAAEKHSWDTRILATDISSQVLEVAQAGIYTAERINPLPIEWQRKYFQKLPDNKVKVVDRIRQEIIFRRFNLMEKVYPFKKKFQVIFCRNVMIYFDLPTKNSLVEKFYEQLQPGGYLFVGHAEALNRETTKFQYVKPAVYRKI